MSKSGPRVRATCSTRTISRLTPRLILGAWTIGAYWEARLTASVCAGFSPVVPMTWTVLACAASAACRSVASGEEKSITASAWAKSWTGSSITAMPTGSSPASVPISLPIVGAARPSGAAGKLAPFRRHDTAHQHLPHAPGAPNHPDLHRVALPSSLNHLSISGRALARSAVRNSRRRPPILIRESRSFGLANPKSLWHIPRHLNGRCCSSVVEHSLGKGEVDSSILSSSTIDPLRIESRRLAPAFRI